jgi:hypothetical protein
VSGAAFAAYLGQRVAIGHLNVETVGRLVRIGSSHLFVSVGAADLACIRLDTVRSIRSARE